ncbi:hypothetical protein GGE08_002719 [Muricauda sp. ARW1Y1]|jgi:hypothetical protein|nr:hypothetical protein [Muricauda sp. ARW1Y1]
MLKNERCQRNHHRIKLITSYKDHTKHINSYQSLFLKREYNLQHIKEPGMTITINSDLITIFISTSNIQFLKVFILNKSWI